MPLTCSCSATVPVSLVGLKHSLGSTVHGLYVNVNVALLVDDTKMFAELLCQEHSEQLTVVLSMSYFE